MGLCFVPECTHHSTRDICKFYRFPNDLVLKKRWISLIRRADREPGNGARVCSCHFRSGNKEVPEIFKWNESKLFESQGPTPKKKVKRKSEQATAISIEDLVARFTTPTETTGELDKRPDPLRVENIILQVELDNTTNELDELKQRQSYSRLRYTVSDLDPKVIRMETGMPNKEIFDIVVCYVERIKDNLTYYYGWKVEMLSLEDQILITLMKLRHNYNNLHIAQLFDCSTGTVANVVLTFLHVLHELLYKDCIGAAVPSREKNKSSLPGSFSLFGNCRMLIDCTDIKVATPGLMSEQKLTYSTYRGMNSFKAIVGVAPNAVITYVSKLFPGSVSDKAIVQESGILNHFVTGDLILADKGFLINDILPKGVYANIPPFLNNGKFTESEIKLTKSIAKCRIHVERANARLKDYKILSFVPPYLRCHSDKVFQLCAALVNLQNPLIKEITGSIDFE